MAPLRRLLRLLRGDGLRQGTWTVLDQALFAGANFGVNVLLARWLTPEAYGAFTVAFTVFLLAGTVHNGLLIEPMLVFGPGRFADRTRAYLRALVGAHGAYALAAGAVLAVVAGGAWVLGWGGMAALFATLAVAQGAILVLWLLRRACYVVERPQWAAAAGALYLVLLLSGAAALDRAEALTGPAALALMAAASLVTAAALAARLRVPVRAAEAALRADARAAHADYGRWAAPTGAIEWAQMAVPYLALPAFVGLEGSGALRAFMNLAMPALMGFAALSTLCIPVFVRARAAGALRPTVAKVGAAFVGLSVAYGALTLVGGRWTLDVLYAGKYPIGGLGLVLLAALPVCAAVANLVTALVRSAERPKAVFQARLVTVAVTSTAGLAATAVLGVAGAIASDVLALVTEVVALRRPARAALVPAPASGDGRADGLPEVTPAPVAA